MLIMLGTTPPQLLLMMCTTPTHLLFTLYSPHCARPCGMQCIAEGCGGVEVEVRRCEVWSRSVVQEVEVRRCDVQC